MKLNPDDLQVASFTTALPTDPKYPPTHPTALTMCFICPEPWTVQEPVVQ